MLSEIIGAGGILLLCHCFKKKSDSLAANYWTVSCFSFANSDSNSGI
jgi:hypothetical protein